MSVILASAVRSHLTIFPEDELRTALEKEVGALADRQHVTREVWEPELDSLEMVGVVVAVEQIFPFPVAPEKIVRPGGYGNPIEAIEDIIQKLREQWIKMPGKTR